MYSVKLQSWPSVVVQYGQEAGWHVMVDLLEESGEHLEKPLWKMGAVRRDMEPERNRQGSTGAQPGSQNIKLRS